MGDIREIGDLVEFWFNERIEMGTVIGHEFCNNGNLEFYKISSLASVDHLDIKPEHIVE